MPIRYWILKDANITYARCQGAIDAAEMRRSFITYLADPDYSVGRPELIDLRGAVAVDIDLGALTMILNKANSQDFVSGRGTLTSVLAPEELAFGLSRQYQGLAETRTGIRVRVTRDEAEALTALNRKESTVAEFLASQPDYLA